MSLIHYTRLMNHLKAKLTAEGTEGRFLLGWKLNRVLLMEEKIEKRERVLAPIGFMDTFSRKN